MPRYLQVLLALTPLLMTPALLYVLAEGFLDFGGGEKDIILTLPWFIWSLVFAICSFFLICRRWGMTRWVVVSALIATIGVVGLGVVAYVGSYLGVSY